MTNEEITKRHNFFHNEETMGVINSMLDAARKDEAEAFGKWILQSAYHKEGCWYLYKDMSGEIYTSEQLYTIFKQKTIKYETKTN